MSNKRKPSKYPNAPAGYRWVINDQPNFIDVQIFPGDHKKRPAVDAFCIIKGDRSEETIDALVIYRMKEIVRGLSR